MHICILDDADESIYTPEFYLKGHTFEKVLVTRGNAVKTIQQLANKNFDMVLNLCDGAWDEDRPGIEVVQALEEYGIPFTGAGEDFYEPTRLMMKEVCEFWGISYPKGVQVQTETDIADVLAHLKFPMIVKHYNSYASIGLTKKSRVTNEEELREQVKKNLQSFGGALVEEFIEGGEYSVLVAENAKDPENPYTFTPIQMTFPEEATFKYESLKWVEYAKMGCKVVTDKVLEAKLRDMAKKVFYGLKGSGYGRCDIRMDKDGVLYLLEINPNGAVFYAPTDPGTADYILQNDPLGHEGFLKILFEAALARREDNIYSWSISMSPKGGFGLFATRAIKKGQVIFTFEKEPHSVASRKTIEAKGSHERTELFKRAIPLCDDVFLTPGPDVTLWRPVNHSCEPNMIFDDLDYVALRDIIKGEELTVDYATVFGKDMPQFECKCGAPSCRGKIEGGQ